MNANFCPHDIYWFTTKHKRLSYVKYGDWSAVKKNFNQPKRARKNGLNTLNDDAGFEIGFSYGEK